MADEYAPPVDYRNQPLAVGDHVTFVNDDDRMLLSGTIAYLSSDHMCIDSGGALVMRKAWTRREAGKPVFVKYRTVALIAPASAPESHQEDA